MSRKYLSCMFVRLANRSAIIYIVTPYKSIQESLRQKTKQYSLTANAARTQSTVQVVWLQRRNALGTVRVMRSQGTVRVIRLQPLHTQPQDSTHTHTRCKQALPFITRTLNCWAKQLASRLSRVSSLSLQTNTSCHCLCYAIA